MVDPFEDYWEHERPSPSYRPSPSGTGSEVDATTGKIAASVYSSREREQDGGEDPVFNKELILIASIMAVKVILWLLYRMAREEGLEITDL